MDHYLNKFRTLVQIMIHWGGIEIFQDALSHMGEATVYRAAAEAQYWFNNDFGRGVDALVTGRRNKFVSAMHQFPPLH